MVNVGVGSGDANDEIDNLIQYGYVLDRNTTNVAD
jgi:hypothetical protein